MFIKDWKKELFSIPNLLSFFRIILLPVYVYIYLNASQPREYLLAGSILGLSCLTDMVDGKIARKFNMITDFGKLADPIADKLMQLSVIGCLTINDRISGWILGLYAVKELVLIVGGLNLLKDKYIVQSKRSGKIATVILFICVLIITVTNEHTFPKYYATMLMFISIAATIFAFFDYAKMYIKVKENVAKSRNNKEIH